MSCESAIIADIFHIIPKKYMWLWIHITENKVAQTKIPLKTNMLLQLYGSSSNYNDIDRLMLYYNRRIPIPWAWSWLQCKGKEKEENLNLTLQMLRQLKMCALNIFRMRAIAVVSFIEQDFNWICSNLCWFCDLNALNKNIFNILVVIKLPEICMF